MRQNHATTMEPLTAPSRRGAAGEWVNPEAGVAGGAKARGGAAALALARALVGAFRPSGVGERALFLTGINLMLVNFIMVQHAIVAFRRAEIAVIAFSLAYFVGVSVGYFVSDRLRPEFVRRSLPAFLVAQMALIAGMQPAHGILGEWCRRIGLRGIGDDVGAGLVLFALLAAFGTSVYAIFLPRVIVESQGDLRRPYSVEVAGSILGLVLMPLLAGVSHVAVLGGYFAAFLALMVTVGTGWRVAGVLAGLSLCFLAAFPSLDRAAAAYTYRRSYGWKVEEVPFSRFTPYQKVEVVRAGGENRLLLDGLRQFGGDPRRTYSYFVAEYPARLLGSPRVALLGCGSMATVGRIGGFVPSIRIVDIDEHVFGAAREHFRRDNRLDQLGNWRFSADDAKHWIANSGEVYDLILHDIPPAKSRQVALTYTDDFFRLVKARLSARGLFSISSLGAHDPRREYRRRMLATLTSVFENGFALERRGSLYFYGGGPRLEEPSADGLLQRLPAEYRKEVTVYSGRQLRDEAHGARIITLSNVGDLIYE